MFLLVAVLVVNCLFATDTSIKGAVNSCGNKKCMHGEGRDIDYRRLYH